MKGDIVTTIQKEPELTELDLKNANAAAASIGQDLNVLLVPLTPGSTLSSVVLPQSGTLEIILETQDDIPEVRLWQQGGSQTPVPLGTTTYQVSSGSHIIFRPPLSETYKLGWRFL